MLIQMAWRNIWRNKTRSVVIITSVALGLLAGVFVMGLYEGIMRSRLQILINTEVSHIQIHHSKFKNDYEAIWILPHPDRFVEEIGSLKEVAVVATRSVANGMLMTTSGSAGIQINGVDPKIENDLSRLSSKLIEGDGFTEAKKNQILIGKKLADKMKVKLGSKLVLTFNDKYNTIVSAAFRVAGIYRSENSSLDERNVFVKVNDFNRLLNMLDECHEVAILLKDDRFVNSVTNFLRYKYPGLLIETWKELSPETKLMLDASDSYALIFIVIIMLALMFGVINTMLMAILERTREIGMLVALGMNKLKLFLLVLCETTLLTLTGVPLGFILSWVAIFYYNQHGIDISSFSGAAMAGFGFSSLIYPDFPWTKLITVLCIVTCTALIASLFPSYKALQLRPVDSMRQ